MEDNEQDNLTNEEKLEILANVIKQADENLHQKEKTKKLLKELD